MTAARESLMVLQLPLLILCWVYLDNSRKPFNEEGELQFDIETLMIAF